MSGHDDNSESSSDCGPDVYNATIAAIHPCHDDLWILRVVPDSICRDVMPGQYTVMGLGTWEPRCFPTQAEPSGREASAVGKVIKRAYSLSCPMVNDHGELVGIRELPWYEFYVALVRESAGRIPELTPRLFALQEGKRLYVGDRFVGRYTLAGVDPDADVLFLATGTGEAPHNAMLAELLARRHRGRITNAVCARYRRDLGYLATHRSLAERYANYRYLPLTTREPENVDEQRADYVGRRYLQDVLESGELERAAGHELDPRTTHIFLCGSPQMIGAPSPHEASRIYPEPTGMVELLERRGFEMDTAHHVGNLHIESYW